MTDVVICHYKKQTAETNNNNNNNAVMIIIIMVRFPLNGVQSLLMLFDKHKDRILTGTNRCTSVRFGVCDGLIFFSLSMLTLATHACT